MLLDAATLPHTCTIRGLTYARDVDEDFPNIGGDSPTPSNRLTSQECWVQPASREEISEFRRRDMRLTHTVFFGEDVACSENEEIVPDNGPAANTVCKVLAYGECTAGLEVGWKAHVEQKRDSRT